MKRLLFLGWDYHIYTMEMVEEFRNLGYDVTFYNVVSFTPAAKFRKLVSEKWDTRVRYFRHHDIVKKEKNNSYDVVFCLLPFFTLENLRELRAIHVQSRFILYLWDAIGGYIRKGIDLDAYLQCFDKTYTFDKKDAMRYEIDYQPLFCVRRFQDQLPFPDCRNGVYMVGNLADFRRYGAVDSFNRYCRYRQISFEWYLKGTLRKNMKIFMQGGSLRNLHLTSIGDQEFCRMMNRSQAVFDFANHLQDGYTMRLMENLCAGKKIITNNRNVLNESFYSPDRFFVFDDLCFDGVEDFLNTPLVDPQARFEAFYLSSFIKKLISE